MVQVAPVPADPIFIGKFIKLLFVVIVYEPDTDAKFITLLVAVIVISGPTKVKFP